MCGSIGENMSVVHCCAIGVVVLKSTVAFYHSTRQTILLMSV